MAKYVILGAGLTGLSAAYHLEQAGCFDYVIFEKNDRPGGLLRSFHQEGFTFDFTGHYLHVSDPYFRHFLDVTVGLNNFDVITRKASIYSHGIFCNYPFQMNLYGLPPEVIYECVDGFLKRKKSLKKTYSFHDWVLKYFGEGMGKYFFFPYNQKLLAYDLKKILPSWTGRFVPQTDLKSMLYGALQLSDQGAGYNSVFYYPKIGGIEFIIQKMATALKNKIVTQHEAVTIDLSKKKITFTNGYQESFEQVISTMPLKQLLQRMEKNTRFMWYHLSEKLLCTTVINFNLGIQRDNLSDKQWIYFPEKEYPFYRLGFWHNINRALVREGCSALYGELSFIQGTISKRKWMKMTHEAIKKALDFLHIKQSQVVTEKLLVLDYAYVIYDAWREKNLSPLLAQLADEGVFSIGRFGGWNYSSMQEAVEFGREAVQQLLIKNTDMSTKELAKF